MAPRNSFDDALDKYCQQFPQDRNCKSAEQTRNTDQENTRTTLDPFGNNNAVTTRRDDEDSDDDDRTTTERDPRTEEPTTTSSSSVSERLSQLTLY